VLRFAIEGRKRVKDQLQRIDTTYGEVRFSYQDQEGKETLVTTLEEEEYPGYYHRTVSTPDDGGAKTELTAGVKGGEPNEPHVSEPVLEEKHLTFQENQKDISFDSLFGAYLKEARKITVTDPYIRLFYQIRNFMEFLEAIVKNKAEEDEVAVHLITVRDEFKGDLQDESFEKIQESARTVGIDFTWEFDESGTIHARHIVTDHGWKISLDRGLDIFQHYEMNEAFAFANRLQQFRSSKAFEVTFIQTGEPDNGY